MAILMLLIECKESKVPLYCHFWNFSWDILRLLRQLMSGAWTYVCLLWHKWGANTWHRVLDTRYTPMRNSLRHRGRWMKEHNWFMIFNSYSASHDNWCTATLWNRIMTVQCEGMGEVGLARYKPALLPPCPSIRALCYSNCQRSTHSNIRAWQCKC